MSDGPVLKPTLIYVSSDLLTRGLRKWSHTVNNDPTERLFKSGYEPEWSYTNVLIRFPHNQADVTKSTVLGYYPILKQSSTKAQ
jgi:hypothetical protein